MVIGLLGLLFPSIGLQIARLREIGDAQWIVLAAVVVVGSAAFLWGNRHRPRFAWPIACGALILVPALSYVSFWRHSTPPQPISDTERHPELTRRKPALSSGEPRRPSPNGEVDRLHIDFDGTLDAEEFALLSEFVKDSVPTASFFAARHRSNPSVASVTIGPVPKGTDVAGRIAFGTVTMVTFDRMRVQVQRPFPPASESIRNRIELALEGLRSGDVTRQRLAVMTLTSLAPLARRDEVAVELLALLSRPNPPVSAVEPFKKWGTVAQVDDLKKLVGKEGINPAHVLEVLAAIAPDEAVRIALELIPKDAGLAKYVLARVGAPAEKAIILSLGDPDPKTRTACCEILLEIGTEASRDPLAALLDDEDPTTAIEARRAHEVIKSRLKR